MLQSAAIIPPLGGGAGGAESGAGAGAGGGLVGSPHLEESWSSRYQSPSLCLAGSLSIKPHFQSTHLLSATC